MTFKSRALVGSRDKLNIFCLNLLLTSGHQTRQDGDLLLGPSINKSNNNSKWWSCKVTRQIKKLIGRQTCQGGKKPLTAAYIKLQNPLITWFLIN